MKIKSLILLGSLVLATMLSAQTDFRPGYIIKSSGDTLYGNIDYRGDLIMGTKCRFKSKDNVINEYSPNDISAFRFIDSKYFASKVINNKNIFLQCLIKAKVSVYYMRDDIGDHYYLDKEGVGLSELPYEEKTGYKDEKLVYSETNVHKGIIKYYMQDAPQLQSRIYDIKKPEHQNLIKLAEDYHKSVSKNEASLIYEKNPPLFKFDIEIIGGLVNYKNISFNDKNYFQIGILANLWLPRINEKLYIKTGVLFSTLESNSESQTSYKFPFQIEYIFPMRNIKPKIAVGVNIYKPFIQTFALTGGVDIKLHKSLYLSVNYNIDFATDEKSPIIPQSIFSQSILTGILIKL